MSFTKRCAGCQQDKTVSDYARSILGTDDRCSYCNECRGTDEPIDETIMLRVITPTRIFNIAAVAIANDDIGYIREMLGRFKQERDGDIETLVRRFADLLQRALGEND